MEDHSWAIKEAVGNAVRGAINNDRPLYRGAFDAVDGAVRQMDFSEAIQAGIVQAAQMGLLTPESTEADRKRFEESEEIIAKLTLEILDLQNSVKAKRDQSRIHLKAFWDKIKENDGLGNIIRKLSENGHYGNCRGSLWVSNHLEPFPGPCTPLCQEVHATLDGNALKADYDANASDIKAGAVQQTLAQNEKKV